MIPRLALAIFAVLGSLLLTANGTGRAATPPNYHMASDSYYRLDVPGGSMTVRVEMEVQAVREIGEVVFWAMPGARNVRVERDGQSLALTPVPSGDDDPDAYLVTFPEPLKPKRRAKFTATYDVGAQASEIARVEPGYIEAMFVSQGPGSFVFLDIPQAGDNFVEPGCVRIAKQPDDVRDAGLERWVCGETSVVAFAADKPVVLERCANLDDACRQRALALPYSGFAQSITDDSKRGRMEADVALSAGTVRLTLEYFRSSQEWAELQFATAQRALPLLEDLFGFPYPHDVAHLRQSNLILFNGAAGLAFVRKGEMLISTEGDLEFDAQVTVHELAHQWSGPTTLADAWLWEGLAEYAANTLATELGYPVREWGWETKGYTDPLAAWWNGSEIFDGHYWYGKANAFWAEFARAVGGREKMSAVLSGLGEAARPADGGWFMDRGELVSGLALDELFLTWVWNRETSAPLLAERRAAHEAAKALAAWASEFGLSGVPTDVQANLDAWIFKPIEKQVADANAVLDEYAAVLDEGAKAGLPATQALLGHWGAEPLAASRQRVDDQRQAIAAIAGATVELANEPEGSAALQQLAKAREEYGAGNFVEAERLAAAARTTAFNETASARMLAIAREKQSGFKPSFLTRVGLLFQDPDADLARAEAAYAAGDHAEALRLARAAYTGWTDATERGLMYLSVLAGLMSAVSVGAWWLLRRLDPHRTFERPGGTGHVIEDRRSGWRDQENPGA